MGPQHVLRPQTALMLITNATWAQATSALGLRVFIAIIADPAEEHKGTWCLESPEPAQRGLQLNFSLLQYQNTLYKVAMSF